MKALDLFCGAGGASAGLHAAGFDVAGVDIAAQPRYPFTFHHADALTFPLEGFDLIWASPPCQAFTALNTLRRYEHPNLIPPMRDRLRASGALYVIENVPGAPLERPIRLCGTMFGLATKDGRAELRRHRLFESNIDTLLLAPPCAHRRRSVGVYGHSGGRSHREDAQQFTVQEWREAMGIDWMIGEELAEAIPPSYAEFIGLAARSALASVA